MAGISVDSPFCSLSFCPLLSFGFVDETAFSAFFFSDFVGGLLFFAFLFSGFVDETSQSFDRCWDDVLRFEGTRKL